MGTRSLYPIWFRLEKPDVYQGWQMYPEHQQLTQVPKVVLFIVRPKRDAQNMHFRRM